MVANPEDPCVFNLTKKGVQCTVAVYVDDLLITCKSQELIDEILEKISARFPDVKVSTGSKHSYLGVAIDLSTDGKVKLSMSGYIEEIMKLYDVKGNEEGEDSSN
jgi:hypothetical protein